MIAKRPGFVAIVVLTLPLGIGVNATIFNAVDACLIRPLPASYPEFEDWRADHGVCESVVASFPRSMNLTGRHEPARVRIGMVSQGYFGALGIQPLLGRTFAAEEHRPGARPVAVIGYRMWQRQLAARPALLAGTSS